MANITIDQVTTKEHDGEGAFDELMAAAQAQLDDQFQKGRVAGPDYSKVYLGMMQSVMAQSINFVLNKQQSDKQADLIAQQTLKTVEETELVKQQVLVAVQEVLVAQQEVLFSQAKVTEMQERALLTKAQVAKTEQETINATVQSKVLIHQAEKLEQEVLVAQQEVLNMQQQVLKSTAEVSILGKQEIKIDKENILLDQQVTVNTSEIALIDARKILTDNQAATELAQELKIDQDTALMVKQGLKLDYEITTYMPQQVAVMTAEEAKIIKETELMTARVANETAQLTVINNQAAKLDAEKDLLIEKKWVEQAQYKDTVGNPASAVLGVIGKQKELYTAQKDGFARDAEQKLTKILVDSFNVRRSTSPDDTSGNVTNKLDDASIGAVVGAAKTGIGL